MRLKSGNCEYIHWINPPSSINHRAAALQFMSRSVVSTELIHKEIVWQIVRQRMTDKINKPRNNVSLLWAIKKLKSGLTHSLDTRTTVPLCSRNISAASDCLSTLADLPQIKQQFTKYRKTQRSPTRNSDSTIQQQQQQFRGLTEICRKFYGNSSTGHNLFNCCHPAAVVVIWRSVSFSYLSAMTL